MKIVNSKITTIAVMFLFAATFFVSCAVCSVTGLDVGGGMMDIDGILGCDGLFEGTSLMNSSFSLMSSTETESDRFHVAINNESTLDSVYKKYQAHYKREMSHGSKDVFKKTLLKVFNHNIRAFQGQETFFMGINKFSDLTLGELKAGYTGLLPLDRHSGGNLSFMNTIPAEPLDADSVPDSMDWRDFGVVTPPKDQGSCESSVIFSSVAAVEAQMALQKNMYGLDLSEQQILDCSQESGIGRCENSHYSAYEYLVTEWLTSESEYQYEAKGGECRLQGTNKIAKVREVYWFEGETQMKVFVGQLGPSSTTVIVNEGFQHYKSGIMSSPCDNEQFPNHSVLVVGYGNDGPGQDYWIIKNSWGTQWGDAGYIKLARNANTCRIADDAIVLVLE